MRFAIICLLSLLLVPALGSEQQRGPSPPPPYQGYPPPYREHPPPYLKNPPPSPEQRPPPRPGNFVYYKGTDGRHTGIALSSRPDRQGHYNLAPLVHPDPYAPIRLGVHTDKIVKAHKGDVVISKDRSIPEVVPHLRDGHTQMQPHVSYALGPVRGSPNYVAEHGGSRRWWGGRRRN